MSFVPVTCPHCTSPRADRIDATHYRCAHCQAMFLWNGPPTAPAAAAPFMPVSPLPAPRQGPNVGVWIGLGAGALLILLTGLGAAVALVRRPPSPPVTRPVAADTTPARPLVVRGSEREVAAPAAPQARVRSFRKGGSASSAFWLVVYENVGTVAIASPTARVSLFDASGKRVLEQTGYAQVKPLAPKETAPILVLAMNPPTFTRAEVAAVTPEPPSSYDTADVRIEVVEFVPAKDGSFTNISGTVKNTSPKAVQFIHVIATGLDSAGDLVSYGDAFATEKQLPPGGSSGFKVTTGTFDVAPPTRYRVVAAGMPVR